MKGLFLPGSVACAIAIACAPSTPAPAPAPTQPSPPLVLPPFQMDTNRNADRVPSFQETPLIVWGPAPAGVSHPERRRMYDLQHQSTTIRFDWPRQAVVGTTTLRIAGLAGAAPVSRISIDAGDMTFTRVATGTTSLKYDSDDHAVVVHLATPLRAGEKTSITIDYDGANRTKGAYFRPARHIVWTQGRPRTIISGSRPTTSPTTRRRGSSTSGRQRASALCRTDAWQDHARSATASSGTGYSTSQRRRTS